MNKPVIIINTFKTIHIPQDKKTIVICDIDHTFIRPSRDYNDIYTQIKPNYSDPKELHHVVNDLLHLFMNSGLVKQTDEDGFSLMFNKIKQHGGKLIFLTARSSSSHEKTISDLQKVGLQNPEDFEIHYTGNEITKGYYIKTNNLLDGYEHHIFIDDFPHFLESALHFYPDMNCYLFKYN